MNGREITRTVKALFDREFREFKRFGSAVYMDTRLDGHRRYKLMLGKPSPGDRKYHNRAVRIVNELCARGIDAYEYDVVHARTMMLYPVVNIIIRVRMPAA